MSKYIDADRLRAEIDKRMTGNCELAEKCVLTRTYECFSNRASEDNDILAIIDSLQQEQPEVDLKKEIDNMELMGVNDARDIWRVARHFFELGQKDAANKFDEIEYNRQRAEEEMLGKTLDEAVTTQMEEDGDVDYFVRKGIDDIALKYAKLGAKWMAGQGYTTEETVYYERLCDETRIMVDFGRDGERGGFNPGDKVIVQIRKKEESK